MQTSNISPLEQNRSKEQNIFANRYYCKKEVANKLKICLRTIDNLMKSGELIPIRLGRAVRFSGLELNRRFG